MINLNEMQIEEIQTLLSSTNEGETLLKELQAKAQSDLRVGKTHIARQLFYYYGANFGINMATELKTIFNEQEREIKSDRTITSFEQRSRIDKLKTSYAEDCFRFASEFKKEYEKLGASIVETARKHLAEPVASVNDPLLESEFNRELTSFNNALFLSRNARQNVAKMNALIEKYGSIPQFASQLNDSFTNYSQATALANGGSDVLLTMQSQLTRIESSMFTETQHEAKTNMEQVVGYENTKLFSQLHIDAIGNQIGNRYASLLNDAETGKGVLDADKQAYVEKEQSQIGTRAFGYVHTAANDFEGAE